MGAGYTSLRFERHLWDDGHSLAQGVQADVRSQETIDQDSSLGLSQSEQGRDQGAFTGSSPPDDANLHPEKGKHLISSCLLVFSWLDFLLNLAARIIKL